jgi:hypothetical protein
MDLNQLLHEHQAAVMRAGAAGDKAGRDDHFAKVAEYAERVRQLRDLHRMPDAAIEPESPGTIIYGTYAGDPEPSPATAPVTDWEGEGGALRPAPRASSDKAVEVAAPNYQVGPRAYQDLGLALEEHLRQLSAEP